MGVKLFKLVCRNRAGWKFDGNAQVYFVRRRFEVFLELLRRVLLYVDSTHFGKFRYRAPHFLSDYRNS